MENLKHLYFFEEDNETKTIRSRYTIGQVLFDIVPVPEQFRSSCLVASQAGVSLKHRPSFYVLKYVEIVKKELPSVKVDDLIYLCGKLGNLLCQTRNRLPVESIQIKQINTDPRLEKKTKYFSQHDILNTKTGNRFLVSVNKLPDYDNV